MTNTKTTKRALFASVISLLVCISMLVGSTFAWFTDSASTGVNKIQAGTLDVDLQDEDGNSLEGKTLTFRDVNENSDILWEPGCTFLTQGFKVVNLGNLAFRYKIVITGLDGDSELLDVIDFSIVTEDELPAALEGRSYTDFEGVWQVIFGEDGKAELVQTQAPSSKTMYLMAHMDEDAGNEYQGLSLEGIGITVYATQDTVENDSFGDQYDKDAITASDWNGEVDADGLAANTNDVAKTVEIETAAQFAAFAEAVNNGNKYAGYTVSLTAPINLANLDWAPIGATNGETMDSYPSYTFAGTFDGNGFVISNLNVISEGANAVAGLFGTANRATIKNVIIDGATIKSEHYAGGILAYETEYTNIINCTVKNATITSSTNGTGDNGDKAGGIVGAMTGANAEFAIANNTVENVAITAYRDAGGIIGYAADGLRVEGNAVKDVVVMQDNTDNYKNAEQTTFGAIVGRGTPALLNNTEIDCKIATGDDVITSQTDLNNAVANGATELVLLEGTYTLPDLTNKNVTVISGKDTKINSTVFKSTNGAEITFKGVTVEFTNANYQGFTHSQKVVYKNCTILGQQTLYAPTVDFINCTFVNENNAYCVWTYGATNATFTGCTFNTAGKAILVYTEGETHANITVDNCVFNDNDAFDLKKAAVEIGSSPYSADTTYNIAIKDCKVNGFAVNDEGTSTGSKLWGNKNSMDKDHLNVVVDGTEVY